MKKKLFGGGIVAGVLAALMFMGGMVSAGAFGASDDPSVPGEASVTPAAIGPRIPESSYVKVTPCRVFDTRKVAAGAFENESRNFDARGNLAAQGGKSGGCAIPSYANSIVITITGVTPTGKGFMRGKAFDGSAILPQATQLNYAPGIDASNTLTLPISQGLSKEFTLGTFGNRVHLVGDVVGYFADPFYAIVDSGPIPPGLVGNRFESVEYGTADGEFIMTVSPGQDIRGCAIIPALAYSDPAEDVSTDRQIAVTEVLTSTSFEVALTSSSGAATFEDFTVAIHC